MAIATELNRELFLDAAISEFKRRLAWFMALSVGFRSQPLTDTHSMTVPYYPLVSDESTDFNPEGGYEFGPESIDFREVVIDKRKYQPIAISSVQLSRMNISAEDLGRQKGRKLAEDVIKDILSLVTVANYGAPVFTGDASTFTGDSVADIGQALDEAEWPDEPRTMVIKPAYHTSLLKDDTVRPAYAYGGTEAIRDGRVPELNGIDIHRTNHVPTNGENLVGMVAHASAIIIGFSPVTPAPEVMAKLDDYSTYEDPEGSGLTLEMRTWGDPDFDTAKTVLECNYGYAKGDSRGLKRMVSA